MSQQQQQPQYQQQQQQHQYQQQQQQHQYQPQHQPAYSTPAKMDVEAATTKGGDFVQKKALVLIFRSCALAFSTISFLLMVIVEDFTTYSALSYVFAIVLVVLVYTAVFVGIHGHEVRTGEVVIPPKVAVWFNFLGDHVLALMLLSAGSAGGEAVTALGQMYANAAVTEVTASVAMAFITFVALESAALISSYNFSVYLFTSP